MTASVSAATPIVTTAIKQAQLPAPMCTGRPSISARRQYAMPISTAFGTTTRCAAQSPSALVLTLSALVEQFVNMPTPGLTAVIAD
jgi:hypothetical protein